MTLLRQGSAFSTCRQRSGLRPGHLATCLQHTSWKQALSPAKPWKKLYTPAGRSSAGKAAWNCLQHSTQILRLPCWPSCQQCRSAPEVLIVLCAPGLGVSVSCTAHRCWSLGLTAAAGGQRAPEKVSKKMPSKLPRRARQSCQRAKRMRTPGRLSQPCCSMRLCTSGWASMMVCVWGDRAWIACSDCAQL